MPNYSNNKKNPTGGFPQKVTKFAGDGAAGFTRVEPWMTPEKLKKQYLFGIPLVSPWTQQTLEDTDLKDIIRKNASDLELKCRVDFSPVQRLERLEFDRTKYLQGWNQLQLPFGNINSIQEVSIRANNSTSPRDVAIISAVRISNTVTVTTAEQHTLLVNNLVEIDRVLDPTFNGTVAVTAVPTPTTFTYTQIAADAASVSGIMTIPGSEGSVLYSVPLDWIDMSQAHKGLLHFVPLQTTFNSYGVTGPSAGAAAPLFAIFSQLQWVPSFWCVRYTCGFEENALPAPINDLIGCWAAMEVISLIGPMNRYNSQSIGIDGSSQSVSGPGPQLYALRYEQLKEKATSLEDIIKSRFGKKIFMSHF